MHADLVRAACQGPREDDAVPVCAATGGGVAGLCTGGGVLAFNIQAVSWLGWWRVVRDALKDCAGRLAIRADAVEAELGTDLQDGLFADRFFGGEFAFDAADVFFADGALGELLRHLLGRFFVLGDEHYAACQAVEAVAGERVEGVSPF